MRVLAIRSLIQPLHKVKSRGPVKRDCIFIEDIEQQRQVAVGSELVCEELAILPDADHIGDEEDSGTFVFLIGRRPREVCVVLAGDGNQLARGRAPRQEGYDVSSVEKETASWQRRTHARYQGCSIFQGGWKPWRNRFLMSANVGLDDCGDSGASNTHGQWGMRFFSSFSGVE